MWLAVAGVGALCAVIVVVVVLSITLSGNSNQSNNGRTPGTVTGTQDEWFESVCKTGTFVDGRGLSDASGGSAMCLPKTGTGYILIGKYDSDFKMRNAIAQRHMKYYVSGIEPDGTVIAFVAGVGDAEFFKVDESSGC